MKKHLDDIIKDIKTFSLSHMQVNSFGFGTPDQIDTKNDSNQFPLIQLMNTNTRLTLNSVILDFSLYSLDLMEQDKANEQHVLSDTLLTALDIVTYFSFNEETYDFIIDTESVTGIPVIGANDSLLAGNQIDFSIEVINTSTTCNIPTE